MRTTIFFYSPPPVQAYKQKKSLNSRQNSIKIQSTVIRGSQKNDNHTQRHTHTHTHSSEEKITGNISFTEFIVFKINESKCLYFAFLYSWHCFLLAKQPIRRRCYLDHVTLTAWYNAQYTQHLYAYTDAFFSPYTKQRLFFKTLLRVWSL